MKNQTTKRSSFSGKIGFVLSAAGRTGKYLAISLSGCQIRRRYFPAYLYHSGIDLWIYDDHGGDIVGTYDEKKSGRSICVLWKFTLVFAGRLDQCNHSGFDRAILFGDRWMGFKISG